MKQLFFKDVYTEVVKLAIPINVSTDYKQSQHVPATNLLF